MAEGCQAARALVLGFVVGPWLMLDARASLTKQHTGIAEPESRSSPQTAVH